MQNSYEIKIKQDIVDRINNLKKNINEKKIKNISYDFKKTPIIMDSSDSDPNEKTEWKSILTDFDVNIVMASNEDKSKFLKLIFDIVDDALNTYKNSMKLNDNEVVFFYKGGNIMRILANHLKKQHIENQSKIRVGDQGEIFMKNFANFFKKSDDDFSIMINIKEENKFNQILSDVNSIIDECLAIIRDQLEDNKQQYFQYFNKDHEYKVLNLQSVQSKFNESDLVKNKEKKYHKFLFNSILFDDVYSNPIKKDEYRKNINDTSKRTDFVVYNDNNNNTLVSTTNNDKTHLFYNYFNTTLTFTRPGNKIISFDLFRTKANFKCFYTNGNDRDFFDLGGELIDISVSKFNDSKRLQFCEDIKKDGLEKYIRKFKVKSNESFYEIRCVTVDYLIHDLEVILFS